MHCRSATQVLEEKIVMAACSILPPGYAEFFSIVSQALLVVLSKMYPLRYRRLAHRIRSSLRPSLHPLGVDPLAIIVVEEDDVHQIMNEGVVAMDHVAGVGFDAPMLEDGPQDLAVVAVNDHLPLNTIPHYHNPLLLQFTVELPKELDEPTDPEAPDAPVVEDAHVAVVDDHKISSLVFYCGMDFNIPIGVVFQNMIAKKKLVKMEASVKKKQEKVDVVLDHAMLPKELVAFTPHSCKGKAKSKGKSFTRRA
ncbi:hypothetical protein AMTR_s00026p00091250 [Amborella trichopoda]|uniref:Uncharacterized protein n=1 Tax=Amborella trichopoda TaxID=13333 RepID=W1PRA4_AMBTC|nr:hypothetical protein AMTR_s00026p00091250 [Amborella trichopoda]